MMKKQVILLIFLMCSISGYAQITLEKGYYIDDDDRRIDCLIKNMDWGNNPTSLNYKLTDDSESIQVSIKSIKVLEILPARNLLFGCGYKYSDSIELRYQPARDIIDQDSNYNTLSLTLGYAIF